MMYKKKKILSENWTWDQRFVLWYFASRNIKKLSRNSEGTKSNKFTWEVWKDVQPNVLQLHLCISNLIKDDDFNARMALVSGNIYDNAYLLSYYFT